VVLYFPLLNRTATVSVWLSETRKTNTPSFQYRPPPFFSDHFTHKTLPTSFVRRRYPLGAFQVFSTPVYILLRTYNYHCLPPAAAASTIAFIFNTISFSLAFYSTSNRRNKKAMKTKKEEEVPLVKHVRPPFL
jgi:hypothetical protein